MRVHRAEVVSELVMEQAESIRWDGGLDDAIWVDMARGLFFAGSLTGGELTPRLVSSLPKIGAGAPLSKPGDGWIVAGGQSLYWIETNGSTHELSSGLTPGADRYFNDGVCGPDGSWWIGTQTQPRQPSGSLYRVLPDLSVREVLTAVTVSNGIAFDPAGTSLFYVDTLPNRALEAFTVDSHGALTRRRTVRQFPVGNPDGICCDIAGCVWVAIWGVGEVHRVTPHGETTDVVRLPVERASAVALIDDVLLVTTARGPRSEPDAGRIFATHVPVPGVRTARFGGGPWH